MSKFNIQTKRVSHQLNEDEGEALAHFKCSVKHEPEPQEPNQKYGFSDNLNKYRNAIDNIQPDDWKKVRWYINEYDFLVKDPIINRAFYKYWEIVNEFELFEEYKDTHLILHCAEAPGGFIQGTNIYLQMDRIPESNTTRKAVKKEPGEDEEDEWMEVKSKKKNKKKDYRIYTISLNKDLPQYRTYNLPSYNKNIINRHICITYGVDKTGNINNWDNVRYIHSLSHQRFYLITADGGFDEGTDFNNKEQLHYGLILSEIYSAIELQKEGGHFILKVFDVFTETSVHLLYLLSLCYEEMYSYKPKTSRPTNSEKYIICKNFILSDDARRYITKFLENLNTSLQRTKSKYTSFTLFDNIPEDFENKINNMNVKLLGKQCEFLDKAVKLCADKTFLEQYDKNLTESLEKRRNVFNEWQEQYNLSAYI